MRILFRLLENWERNRHGARYTIVLAWRLANELNGHICLLLMLSITTNTYYRV
jgi:hypothetical protein